MKDRVYWLKLHENGEASIESGKLLSLESSWWQVLLDDGTVESVFDQHFHPLKQGVPLPLEAIITRTSDKLRKRVAEYSKKFRAENEEDPKGPFHAIADLCDTVFYLLDKLNKKKED